MSRTITVTGMSCEDCEESVESALRDVPGVSSATADRASETATVEGDADLMKLVDAVETAGYDAQA